MKVEHHPRARLWFLLGIFALMAVITVVVTAVLVTIVQHKQEARTPFVRLVEVTEMTSDPQPWGTNWPRQYDSYQRTVDVTETRYGGSSAIPEQKLDASPWLRRLYAGYAFSIDYRERRGHAYMLADQTQTERVMQKPQSGSCLHCHSSIIPTYRRLGLIAQGVPLTDESLGGSFNEAAVMKGFEVAARMTFAEAERELRLTPDGTPNRPVAAAPKSSETAPTTRAALAAHADLGDAHPVSCVDCHDPATMKTRVTRPGFILGIQALAKSEDPVRHLPSIGRWRQGDRKTPYHPNTDATRQEMRSFTCAQCHVEYYCATSETLFFPWQNGLKVEDIEKTYDNHTFPDGKPFTDFKHGETGAKSYKAQHPEFELWSQGVHARSGVSCADCHMPYQREGAMKVSSHWVRSPLLNAAASCQPCHNVPESELVEKVHTIQDRTSHLIERSAAAMTEMLDAIREAKAGGATEEQLRDILDLQRKATWRLDFVASENSMGFHADQESARILAESIDYSRKAQAAALRLRPKNPATTALEMLPVQGVTPASQAPQGVYQTTRPSGAR
jgi:nitrite reductase (cytochrome c-552)